jgi:hypothetical protein
MRTTVDINDALLKAIRERAASCERPFREVLEETLKLGLARSPRRKQGRFVVKPHRLGLKPGFRGLSLNQLYDQIEAEEKVGKS